MSAQRNLLDGGMTCLHSHVHPMWMRPPPPLEALSLLRTLLRVVSLQASLGPTCFGAGACHCHLSSGCFAL